jgi:hypothetical protein
MENSNVEFMTIKAFKAKVGATELNVVRSPKTQKLFLASDQARWKCQGDIDKQLPMAILVPDGDLDKACLVNVNNDPSENLQFSL